MLYNNTLIEIDHCSPLEILKPQKNLVEIAKGEGTQKLKNMKEKRSRKQLSQRNASQNPNKGILRPKIDAVERRKQSGKNPGP